MKVLQHWVGPTKCLEDNPTPMSIRFGGRYINMSTLSKDIGADHGYLSYILSGQRTPSIAYAQRIAQGLGMDLSELLYWIEERRQEIDERNRKLRA